MYSWSAVSNFDEFPFDPSIPNPRDGVSVLDRDVFEHLVVLKSGVPLGIVVDRPAGRHRAQNWAAHENIRSWVWGSLFVLAVIHHHDDPRTQSRFAVQL